MFMIFVVILTDFLNLGQKVIEGVLNLVLSFLFRLIEVCFLPNLSTKCILMTIVHEY